MVTRDSREALEALADPELDAAFSAVAAQHRRGLVASWQHHAQRLRARGTPLRSVTKFGDGVARLQFADSTALLVSTANPSRHFFSLVVARAKGRAVVITAIHDDGERFMVRLEWQGQHVDVEIVGGDQPA